MEKEFWETKSKTDYLDDMIKNPLIGMNAKYASQLNQH